MQNISGQLIVIVFNKRDKVNTMSKELERLEKLTEYFEPYEEDDSDKALECLGNIYLFSDDYNDGIYRFEKEYNTIKNYILKTQENEDKAKVFDLINEKDVDIKLLKWAYPSVEAYNVKVRTEKDYWWRKELTKEEFEFIGRLVGAK